MSGEAEKVNAYLDTVNRLEPEIHMVDLEAGITSIAVSLKRIADSLNILVTCYSSLNRSGGSAGR